MNCKICGLEHEREENAVATVCTDALLDKLANVSGAFTLLQAEVIRICGDNPTDGTALGSVVAMKERSAESATRERAALEQARLARRSVAELTERLQAAEARAAELERERDKWHTTVNTYVTTKNPDLEYGAFKEICEMLGLDVMAQSRYQEEEDDYQDMLRQRNAAQAQAAQLRDALKFYANNDDVIFRTDDGGKVASHALSAAPEQPASVRLVSAEYLAALEAEHDTAIRVKQLWKLGSSCGCQCDVCKWSAAINDVEAARKGGER